MTTSILRRGVLAHLANFALFLIFGFTLTGCMGVPPHVNSDVQHTLAPTGALRVALYTGTPTSMLSATDQRGVGYDLGKELARRLGVAFQPTVFPKNDDVLEAVRAGRADVAFTNASAERATGMDFTQPYLLIEMGFLASEKANVSVLKDVDQPGVRVGATAKSTSDVVLSRELKNAKVVKADSVSAGIELLSSGKADVYATNKAALFEMATKLPGSHVLDGNWGVEHHALAMPKGRELALPYAREFIANAVAEGLVKRAIEHAGLRGGIVATP